jgi:hypothetical protein
MGARRTSSLTLLSAAAPAFLLAACGGLTTPDTSTGELTGRLTNVVDASSAHVYVVGHPETVTKVESDGSYTLRKVPVGDPQVVFYDGKDHAGVVAAPRVEPAKITEFQKDARELPVAARVFVIARGGAGVSCDGATVQVEGSILKGQVKYGDGPLELFPVPPGDWSVRGDLKGFKKSSKGVSVPEGGRTPIELTIEDPDDSAEQGCNSSACADGLKCDGDDGRCYACTKDLDCGAGFACEHHSCVPTSGDRDVCEACSSNADCGPGGACVGLAGGTAGVCATPPSSSHTCKSGYQAGPLAGVSSLCAPPRTFTGGAPVDACARLFTTFGSLCLTNETCAKDLAGGTCLKPGGAGDADPIVGVCTAPCQSNSDCPDHVDFGKCSAAGFCERG